MTSTIIRIRRVAIGTVGLACTLAVGAGQAGSAISAGHTWGNSMHTWGNKTSVVAGHTWGNSSHTWGNKELVLAGHTWGNKAQPVSASHTWGN